MYFAVAGSVELLAAVAVFQVAAVSQAVVAVAQAVVAAAAVVADGDGKGEKLPSPHSQTSPKL